MTLLIRKIKHYFIYPAKFRKLFASVILQEVTPNDFLDPEVRKKIFSTYRDIFGHGGDHEWGEYARCASCKKVYDIETVHGFKEYIHISSLPTELPESRCCSAPLEYFYEENLLEKRFKSILSKNGVMYVLKDEKKDHIVGLIIGCVCELHFAWREYIQDKLILQKGFQSAHPESNEKLVYIDEIGVVKSHRHGRFPFFSLFHAFLKKVQKNHSVSSILFWTHKGSKLYHLTQQVKHEILVEDLENPPRAVITVPFSIVYRMVRFISMVYN